MKAGDALERHGDAKQTPLQKLVNGMTSFTSQVYHVVCVKDVDFTSKVKMSTKRQKDDVAKKLVYIRTAADIALQYLDVTPEKAKHIINDTFNDDFSLKEQ